MEFMQSRCFFKYSGCFQQLLEQFFIWKSQSRLSLKGSLLISYFLIMIYLWKTLHLKVLQLYGLIVPVHVKQGRDSAFFFGQEGSSKTRKLQLQYSAAAAVPAKRAGSVPQIISDPKESSYSCSPFPKHAAEKNQKAKGKNIIL